jgi:hypothetical protein
MRGGGTLGFRGCCSWEAARNLCKMQHQQLVGETQLGRGRQMSNVDASVVRPSAGQRANDNMHCSLRRRGCTRRRRRRRKRRRRKRRRRRRRRQGANVVVTDRVVRRISFLLSCMPANRRQNAHLESPKGGVWPPLLSVLAF